MMKWLSFGLRNISTDSKPFQLTVNYFNWE